VLPQQDHVRKWPLLFSRYRFISRLAEGGFSQIVLAEDTAMLQSKRPRNVAIKIMNAKHNQIGHHEFKRLRTLNLKDVEDTTHIIRVHSSFYFQNHYCLVFELLGESLLSHLQKYPPYTMPIHELKKITVQLLAALCFLHNNRIAHADLKPENLLLAKDTLECKIVDFGNSIDTSLNEQQPYYQDFNVQTLYYRAPEVVFGLSSFELAIDMWSLACILFELYTGEVLFKCRNPSELADQMKELLGDVPASIYRNGKFFKEYQHSNKQSKTIAHDKIFVRLYQRVRLCDANFVKFLQGLLEYDPTRRLTAQDALMHPFLSKMFPFSLALQKTERKKQQPKAKQLKRSFDQVSTPSFVSLRPPNKAQRTESPNAVVHQVKTRTTTIHTEYIAPVTHPRVKNFINVFPY
jgi:serine/threonine protein kinase